MKPQAFYDFAAWLLANLPADPAGRSGACRTVISRGYYGALHTAAEALAAMGVVLPRSANLHTTVPDLLQHAGDADVVEAGVKLNDLRSERNDADYDLDSPTPESITTAQLRLNDAGKVIAVLNTLKLGKGTPGSRYEQVRSATQQRAAELREGPSA